MEKPPNDSAISVATAALNQETQRTSIPRSHAKNPSTSSHRRPKSSSPRTQPTTHQDLNLISSEQAAIENENASAATQAQHQIDIDDTVSLSSIDTGYESDSLASSSTSLSSSVRDYTFENGRRYHKFREGTYNFPNDDSEQDREDMKHAMMVNLCQRLHFAPFEEGKPEGGGGLNILDIGTGTGIWAIESMSLPLI